VRNNGQKLTLEGGCIMICRSFHDRHVVNNQHNSIELDTVEQDAATRENEK